jgi:hypothetical protein
MRRRSIIRSTTAMVLKFEANLPSQNKHLLAET